MVVKTERGKCMGCGACIGICVGACIAMDRDVTGFSYPVMAMGMCMGCGMCDAICPIEEEEYFKPKLNETYTCKKGEFETNAFMQLASGMIENGGKVFVPVMSEESGFCEDIMVEKKEDLKGFCYPNAFESGFCNSMFSINKLLKTGEKILFAGTPCQVLGMRTYLQMDNKNLICVEFDCKGVYSTIKNEAGEYIMRPSCGEDCPAIGQSSADITLCASAEGTEKECGPEKEIVKFIVNTKKGKEFCDSIGLVQA